MRSKEGRTQTLSRISSVTRSTFSAKNLAIVFQDKRKRSENGNLRADRIICVAAKEAQVNTLQARRLLDTYIGS